MVLGFGQDPMAIAPAAMAGRLLLVWLPAPRTARYLRLMIRPRWWPFNTALQRAEGSVFRNGANSRPGERRIAHGLTWATCLPRPHHHIYCYGRSLPPPCLLEMGSVCVGRQRPKLLMAVIDAGGSTPLVATARRAAISLYCALMRAAYLDALAAPLGRGLTSGGAVRGAATAGGRSFCAPPTIVYARINLRLASLAVSSLAVHLSETRLKNQIPAAKMNESQFVCGELLTLLRYGKYNVAAENLTVEIPDGHFTVHQVLR